MAASTHTFRLFRPSEVLVPQLRLASERALARPLVHLSEDVSPVRTAKETHWLSEWPIWWQRPEEPRCPKWPSQCADGQAPAAVEGR